MEALQDIKDIIYTIRGVQVMMDADLAVIYGYTTKAFNQQVKNNIEKFDDDFRFQLTQEEYNEILRSKKLTLNTDTTTFQSSNNDSDTFLRSNFLTSKTETRGGRQYLPYVFTEQGIYMLMTVLKGELATRQSKALIRVFKEMKDFIIDNYIGLKTLVLLKSAQSSITITIYSDNIGRGLHKSDYNDFHSQYPKLNISFRQTGGIYHDRYIVLDYNTSEEKIYHCGASSKDAGNKVTTITEVADRQLYHPIVDALQHNPKLTLK